MGAPAFASNYDLSEIPHGIPAEDAAKLKAAGVSTTFALLEKAGEGKARKALAKSAKVAEKSLEAWVEMADLCRIRGIGPDVARLLQAVNVHGVSALKTANADKLAADIGKANEKQKLTENSV